MKKSLLTLGAAVLLSASVFAQDKVAETTSFTGLTEDHDKVTPCFTSWPAPGDYQWSPGHEIVGLTPDYDNSAIILKSTANDDKAHADAGPAYYKLTTLTPGSGVEGGQEEKCNAGTGIVDVTKNPQFVIKMKASAPVKVTVYIQEGNSPSWNYSKFSQAVVQADVTTEYQEFRIDTISATNVNGDGTIDLTQIGGLAFSTEEEAKAFEGTITIDYFKLGDDAKKEASALTDAEVANLNAQIFPNPANDLVNVTYNVPADESVVVTLSNSLGQAVASVDGGESSASIDVSDLNSGLYFASIVVDGVVVSTQRVIVE